MYEDPVLAVRLIIVRVWWEQAGADDVEMRARVISTVSETCCSQVSKVSRVCAYVPPLPLALVSYSRASDDLGSKSRQQSARPWRDTSYGSLIGSGVERSRQHPPSAQRVRHASAAARRPAYSTTRFGRRKQFA